jgi:hypothetical protein
MLFNRLGVELTFSETKGSFTIRLIASSHDPVTVLRFTPLVRLYFGLLYKGKFR